jgi:thioredoxin 2
MTSAAAPAKHITLRCQFCETWNRIDAARAADRPKCGKCERPFLVDRPVSLNDETFSRTVEGSDVPVLVDFYADWCGPCKMMAPVLDQVARERTGRVLVAKVDTDANPMLARKFSIASIPTLITFSGGEEVGRELGALPKPRLDALIDRALR